MIRAGLKYACLGLAALVFAGGLALDVAVHAVDYDVAALSPDASGPLLVVDRRGELLRSLPQPGGRPGREQWVPLERISSHLVLTLLASEDQRFFEHGGVDPWGVLRAAWLNLRHGKLGYGASTLTMQLMRMVHSPGQRRSLGNKIKEAVLALRVERALSKRAILEQYLNRAYFGNGAYGIEAAARTYFDKPAAALSVGEAALLAVVPRGPEHYDPLRHRARALKRRDHLFALLVRQGRLDPGEARRARAQRVRPRLHRPPFRAPHFVDWVARTLPEAVRRRGGVVHTTLDLRLQQLLQRRVAEHVATLRARRVFQAGVVVLDTDSGEVLAMVGSAGFFGPNQGQVNIVTRRRHPGSALKPFVYALALEAGDSPATIAYDIHDLPGSRYRVGQLTQRERGPVRYREALAGSYNLAAVHTLERVGVEKLLARLRHAGVGELRGSPRDYGLRLALGAAKVRLLDLAAGYGFLARAGRVRRPSGVTEVRFHGGGAWRPAPPGERQVFSPQVSWLVLDMLADPVARRPMFGQELPVDLPFRVAVKTGTARGFADTVAVGVTRELTVAAWAGNFDGRPSNGVLAMRAAAPLVRAGLLLGGGGNALTLPPRPAGITSLEVCPLSGLPAGPHCPHRKLEHFVAGRAPAGRCDWHLPAARGVRVAFPAEIARWARRVGLTYTTETAPRR